MPNKILVCQQCGTSFKRKVTPSAIRRGNLFIFCSAACRNKARSLSSIPCPICGKSFKPHRINGAGQPRKRFCSRACASLALRGKASSKRTDPDVVQAVKTFYPREGAQGLAKQFGKSIKAIQMIAKKAGIVLDADVYRERVHESARKYMRTSKNPGYKDGHTCKEWGNNWLEQRRLALRRDSRICQYCHKPGRTVHHIKPRKSFIGHMEDANRLDNLITLCAADHERVEMGKINCPQPIR